MLTKKSLRTILFTFAVISAFWWSQNGAARYINGPGLSLTNSDPVIGSPFNISTGSIDEAWPAVAYNPVDREYLVVWSNLRATNDIYAQRISEQGKLLSWFYVANGEVPAVAYNEKNNTYLVVYYKYVGNDFDVYARRINFAGPTSPEFPVAFNLSENEILPSVAYNMHPSHDEFLIVWQNNVTQPSITKNIEAQRVAGTAGGGNGGGDTIGGRIPVAVSSDINYEPDVTYNLNMNEYMTVYTRIGSSLDVYGRRITGGGVLLAETPIDTSGNDQHNPTVAAYHLNTANPYLVVFTDTWNDAAGDVRGYLVDQQGQPVLLINIATTQGQREYEPAIDQSKAWGGYMVTWTQGPISDLDIFGMRVSEIGVTHPEFDISHNGTVPMACDRAASDIGLGNTATLAVWSDDCGSAGGLDILGRMLGYRVNLPLTIR